MTTKILDNTVISASIKEIKCIDLIKKCLERYNIVTSIEVYEETSRGFGEQTITTFYKKITVYNLRNNKLFLILLEYLEDRYPYLHKGEISTFLIALLEYELKKRKYYFVTDDNRMRKVIKKIFDDSLFKRKLRSNVSKFHITGTIGLIKRLYERGILSRADIEMIIEDLKNSTFYLTDDLIKYLRG